MPPKTAYITGGASGIGLAVATKLNARGYSIALADFNIAAAQAAVDKLESSSNSRQCIALETDVRSWKSQVVAFQKAVDAFGRIDVVIVNAGIGERAFVVNDGGKGTGFVEPDMSVLEVDLQGFMYTVSLAVQQMRRQEVGEGGFRGKIIGTASVCGFYCVPTLPIYTAAKHGAVGLVRSYGKYLPEEKITLNAVCPHVLRTGISTATFYDDLESKGLLTSIEGVVESFEKFIDMDMSGECLEIGPVGGPQVRAPAEVLNKESQRLNELLYHRGHPLHEVRAT